MISAWTTTLRSCFAQRWANRWRLPALCVVAMLAAGCATPVYENSLPWAEGWRVGKVSRVEATAQDLAFYKRRCKADQL